MSTPMMRQYLEAKNSHPGMLLLFRMGDFYELFNDDAKTASRILGLTLTSRDKTVPMAGFPHHALDHHLPKLLRAGLKVAICDQVEDPALAKGLVRREVTRVVTPGTLTEEDLLDPKVNNHLACVCPLGRGRWGLSWVELSTGQFHAANLSEPETLDLLGLLGPAEILYFEERKEPGPPLHLESRFPEAALTARPDWTFDLGECKARLFSHFGVSTLAGFGFDDHEESLRAAGALLGYLKDTLKASPGHLRWLRPYSRSRILALDEVTRRSLELTRTLRDGNRQGSLLHAIDRTATSMGARLLGEWLLSPLAEAGGIQERLDAVEVFQKDFRLRQELRGQLSQVFDLQRLASRTATLRAGPRDLGAIGKTLEVLPRVRQLMESCRGPLLPRLASAIDLMPALRGRLQSALADSLPISPKEGGIFRPGFDPALDELRQLAASGQDWITRFQAEEIARTGINSLKVGFNQVFGYYIEITHAHSSRVPDNYHRKQTLKNAERYITPELKEQEDKVLQAQDRLEKREYELFAQLREETAACAGALLQTAEALAAVDVLCGLGELASERGWCKPTLSQEPALEISEGKHPVLEQSMPAGTFVPNSASMGPDAGMVLLITGPNMGGKSVYIRQVALITLLAHAGSFVPARQAVLGLTDRIFTRVGASDELGRAQSTFMVEMTEAANILNNATHRSLVILDEIGRGTSTYDGVSLAWAISEFLHDHIGCRTLFATHYHELAQLADSLARFRNYQVRVRETQSGILFLHRIEPGSADQSYGIHVAQRAGVPVPVLERARHILHDLEDRHLLAQENPGAIIRKPKIIQGSLFATTEDPLLASLRETDFSKMSAEEALKLVQRWQKDLGKDSARQQGP